MTTEPNGISNTGDTHHCPGCRCDEILALIAELKENLRLDLMPHIARVDAERRPQLEGKK